MSDGGTVASRTSCRKRESRWSKIVEPPPEARALIERTARWVALDGVELENKIRHYNVDRNLNYARFSFLRWSDPHHAYYQLKLTEYRAQKKNGTLEDDDIQSDDDERVLDLRPPPLCEALPPLRASTCVSAFTCPPGITLKELGIIKFTAQFLALYGSWFWRELMTKVYRNPQFDFMKPAHSRFGFYTDLIVAYSRVLRTSTSPFNVAVVEHFFHRLQLEKLDEGLVSAMIDLHAFVGGVDCFTHLEFSLHSLVMQPPQRFSKMMNRFTQTPPDQNPQPDAPALTFPARITFKELGIMKLTAQFVARYGICFRRALMVRVVTIPQFEFMEKTHSRNFFFNLLVDAYSGVLRPSKILKASDACTATVLEVFFHRLQLEKLKDGVKDGVETAMIDLHAFVGGLDCFAHKENHQLSAILPPPEPISTMMKWLTQPDMLLRHTLGPLFSIYYLKTHFIEDDPLAPHHSVADFLRIPPQRSLSFTFPAIITLKELGVIKLTAQFVARYGPEFLRDLAAGNPLFEFINSGSSFYNGLFDAYAGVLNPYKKPEKSRAITRSALDVFLSRLQLEKLEEGVEKAMIDLHAFMGGVDYFAHMDDINYSAIMPPPQRFSTMMNGPKQMRPDMLVQPPVGSQHSEYRAQNEDGARDIQPDPPATHECVGDEQPDLELPPSKDPPGPWLFISPLEFGILKITALFAARYGTHFCRELMKRVVMKPLFKFMEPADSRFSIYKVFVDAYSRVVKPANDVCMATVLKGFFCCLQLDKLEEGVETAMLDLHAFVSGVDCFAEMEGINYSTKMENVDYSAFMPKPQRLSMLMNSNPRTTLLGIPFGSEIVHLRFIHYSNGPYGTMMSLARG